MLNEGSTLTGFFYYCFCSIQYKLTANKSYNSLQKEVLEELF
jgi:hypothetical protein